MSQRQTFWLCVLLVIFGGVFIYQKYSAYDALQGRELELDAAKFTINGIGFHECRTVDDVIKHKGSPSQVGKHSAIWRPPNKSTTFVPLGVEFDENRRLKSVDGDSLEYDGQVILKRDDLKERAETLVGHLAPVDIYHTDERGSPFVEELYYNRALGLQIFFVSRKDRPFRVAQIALVTGGYRYDINENLISEHEPRKYPVFRVPVGTKPVYEHRDAFTE